LEAEPLWPQRQALLGRSAPHPSAAWGRRAAMLLGPLAERLAGGGPGARQAFLPVVPLGLRLLGRSPSEPAWPMPDVRCHRRPVARGPVGQRPPVGRCHDAHGLTSPAGGGSARPALSLAPASRQPPGGVGPSTLSIPCQDGLRWLGPPGPPPPSPVLTVGRPPVRGRGGLPQWPSGKPRRQEEETWSPVGGAGIGSGAPQSLPLPRAFGHGLFGSVRLTGRQAVLHTCASLASSPRPRPEEAARLGTMVPRASHLG
jgi:hypothetical protein